MNGYRQRQGIDYDKTFSFAVIIKSIRVLLVIVTHDDYEIQQMNVKTIFLNENLKEEVYMMQLKGYSSKEFSKKLCKLQRPIYGLKQAFWSWNMRFNYMVKSYDFIQNENERCAHKKISESVITFLVLYICDILLIENDVAMLSQ